MLLTLSTTHVPATDLGFLLHKNPARAQSSDAGVGTVHVFYPEANDDRCTVALLLEVDPIGLVRGRNADADGPLASYVNDRPYVASSLLAVALGKAFSSARRGVCRERPELAQTAIPLEAHLPALSCRGGTTLAERFFAPLGWEVEATAVSAHCLDVRLRGTFRLAEALNHLYVALPVLDDTKHYWVGEDEVHKLLRAGEGWLAGHPEAELISHRYLAHRRSYTRAAMERLADLDGIEADALDAVPADSSKVDPERPAPLALQRHEAVLAVLREAGARRVVDLGAGSGALLPALLADPSFTEIVAVEVSHSALAAAARRLRLDRMPDRQRARVQLLQGALTYTDDRLVGFDAAVLMEVVEHLDLERLPALEHAVFGHARPGTVVVTTPNAEFNVCYEGLAPGAMRHRDHRFEWTRAEFAAWSDGVAERHGYDVRRLPVGTDDPEVGPPTQLAVFTKRGPA